MATNHTCRVCLSSLTKKSRLLSSPHLLPHKFASYIGSTSLRSLTSPSRYPTQLDLPTGSTSIAGALAHSDPVVKKTSPAPKNPDPASPGQNPLPALSTARLAQQLRKRASGTTETYVAYGATEQLFKECSRHADYTIPEVLKKGGVAPKNDAGEDVGVGTGWWYESVHLTPTFNTWAQITFIHMYMLTVRFRLFPAAHAPSWHQHLLDHFFHNAEDRMAMYHGMAARSIRNKYLKDLYIQWRGVLAAYDEGLVKGDAVLATAIWRNVFKADQATDVRALAEVVGWMRREIKRLDKASDGEVSGGGWRFVGDPNEARADVMLESQMMKEKV